MTDEADRAFMRRALELAARGEGHVEPNPMVGCVLVRDGVVVGEGWHRAFGGPHAEVEALRSAGEATRGATAYVTLEPCCHHGKTPPCTDALLAAGVRRVVAAQVDPFPRVAGGGLAQLRAAGVLVEVGVAEEEARTLNAPYHKRLATGRPWIIAKWAMTLDGKIATRTGDSRWISGEVSRAVGHRLRGRVDAILVGLGTALRDDPLLTARPPGPRVATRIVADSSARLPLSSQLVRTARDVPTLVACSHDSPVERRTALQAAGCETLVCAGATPAERLGALLDERGRRGLTNVLVEGGGTLLGALFDQDAIDEIHVFVAPRLIGGASAPSPLGGTGRSLIGEAVRFELASERTGDDVYFHGRRARP